MWSVRVNPEERRRVFQDMRGPRPLRPAGQSPQQAPQPIRRPMQPVAPSFTQQRPAPLQQRAMPGRPLETPQRRRFPKAVIVAVVAVLLLALPAWFLLSRNANKSAKNPGGNTQQAAGITGDKDTIRLLATGDFIAHDSVNAAAKQSDGTYNYLPLMDDFPALFKKADIRFCNDPILNGGKALGITGYPKFNSPTEFVTDMGRLGCNLANTASNHSFDFKQANISASVDAWDKVPNMLAVAGENRSQAEHDKVHYFTVKGVKFAFLAYTTYINTDSPAQNDYGVNVFSKDFAGRQIDEAKQNGAQIIIASMRWGTEYAISVDAEQKADAQWLADHGVQLVLGHGSHELQPVQQLTGADGTKSTVWYSLGNFLNTQEPPETLFNGLAVMDIDAKTKTLKTMSYLPIYMHYEWTAAQAKADDTNARTNVHLYLLEDATQGMLDKQQLKTTIAAQKARITDTLSANGVQIPLITSKDLD
ncbi:MAG TPA: CapA family protein [Candidatus Saccharimonadales bacterium]|nr:CapA family protein [Candidatus Saccharimonadales bacterium]